jgi:hypothetical protein
MAYHVYRASDGRAVWPIITQYQLPPRAMESRSIDVELLASCKSFLVAWEVAHAFIPSPGAAPEVASTETGTSLLAALPARPRKSDIEV